MYIQDENQRIVANLDISGEWNKTYGTSRMWTLVVVLPEIGALVTYKGKPYEILTTTTIQEQSGHTGPFGPKFTITTFCDILEVTDEGDDAGEEPISVKADELELI